MKDTKKGSSQGAVKTAVKKSYDEFKKDPKGFVKKNSKPIRKD